MREACFGKILRVLFIILLLKTSGAPVRAEVSRGAGVDREGDPLERFLQLRDPFKKPQIWLRQVVKTPLEAYAVNTYKMIGVLTGPYQTRAILVDPSGKSHFVGLNMKIGLHEGQVIHIGADRVVVREKVTNLLGKSENNDIDIPMAADGNLKVTKAAGGVTGSDALSAGSSMDSQDAKRFQQGFDGGGYSAPRTR